MYVCVFVCVYTTYHCQKKGIQIQINEQLYSVAGNKYNLMHIKAACVCLCVCVHTIELTAYQLHTQGARLATHHRDDADKLGDYWRVEQISLGAVVVHVPYEHLTDKVGLHFYLS